jgi:hypothetical protein
MGTELDLQRRHDPKLQFLAQMGFVYNIQVGR